MISELLGILGVVMVLSGYFLLVAERLRESDSSYLGLNVLGSALILVSLARHFNLAATIMQAAWILISVAGALRRRRPAGGG